MKKNRSLLTLALAAAVALPTMASAQIVQLELVNVGIPPVNFYPAGPNYGPVIGPFQLRGLNPVLAPFNAFCVDLQNDVRVGQIWNARVLTFSEAISGANIGAVNRALGTNPTWNQTTLNQAAWLSGQFAVNPTGNWDEIQSVVWHLFDPYVITPSDPALAGAFLASSAANAGGDFSNWRLIVDNNAWNEQYEGPYVQTFMSTVPEPSTYALMGIGLLAVGFAARRRSNGRVTA